MALSPEHVGELQRARILAAMSELVRERGVGRVTVADVVARSGVSRRTFYELFTDREACLLAAFDHAVDRTAAVLAAAYRGEGSDGARWEQRLRATVAALLGFFEEEPALAGLLIVGSLAGERRLLECRARTVDALVRALHRTACAAESSTGGPPDRIIAEGAVGAVLAVLHRRLLQLDAAPLGGMLNPLVAILVLPYLGSEAASGELKRPRRRTRRRTPALADPLRGLEMRLTYRTVRVLLAIGELGGGGGSHPNGRQVADAAGISDQGQVSKLLARLEHLGLIHNNAPARGRGEPNAWALTDSGARFARAIRDQTNS